MGEGDNFPGGDYSKAATIATHEHAHTNTPSAAQTFIARVYLLGGRGLPEGAAGGGRTV